ncbi:MAG TPA: alpha-galactosidase [Chloroflexi bacterium]|jgi:alpha-galactosidase|nr:alpha-galactosidase [Chloroflexota bacterium]
MSKITIVGAGSHVFAQRLIADVLTWPSLQDSTVCLMDIDAERLEVMAALARKMVRQLGVGATIESTTELEPALDGADYVITSIRVGQSVSHVSIPLKYGINQAVGDSSGPGGVFYFLKNGPAILEIARTMERLCPNALMLNYTNPMVMLSKMVTDLTSIRYVGLCHSVQGTANTLAGYIGAPVDEISYWAAGINHMAWFLEYRWKGEDAYPLLWKAMEDPDIYERDIVKWEIMRHFGAFVSESSIHMSEYVPYFRRTPEMIDRYTSEKMWGVGPKGMSREERLELYRQRREEQERETLHMAYSDEEMVIERSHEFCTYILNAIESNTPYVFNGNVPNTGLITNLPPASVVEVPIVADGCGLHPCHVGDLPEALAALNRTNLNVQNVAVRGFIEGNRELIYRAVQLDPLTASLLTLPEIRNMVDEMFQADAEYITI